MQATFHRESPLQNCPRQSGVELQAFIIPHPATGRNLDIINSVELNTLIGGRMKPPATIDGARVIEWAWSGDKPFGRVIGADPSEAVFGLAIASYEKTKTIYRFSCDARWETVQDGLYSSVEEAKQRLPSQYQEVAVAWHPYEA